MSEAQAETIPDGADLATGEDATDEAETTDEAQDERTLDEAVAEIADASRMVSGATVAGAVQAIRDVAVIAASAAKSATVARKAVAAAIARHARRNVILPTGLPDWAGTSGLAVTIEEYAFNRVMVAEFPSPAERRRERNAIMGHVDRTFLELEITDWVWTTATTLTEDERLFEGDEPDYSNPVFLHKVRAAYKSAGKKVPTKYQTPQDKEEARKNTPTSGPVNPVAVTRKGIEAASALTAVRRAVSALQLVTNLVHDIEENEIRFGSQDERNAVIEYLGRVSIVSMFGQRVLDGVATEKDVRDVSAAYFNEDADTIEDEAQDEAQPAPETAEAAAN